MGLTESTSRFRSDAEVPLRRVDVKSIHHGPRHSVIYKGRSYSVTKSMFKEEGLITLRELFDLKPDVILKFARWTGRAFQTESVAEVVLYWKPKQILTLLASDEPVVGPMWSGADVDSKLLLYSRLGVTAHLSIDQRETPGRCIIKYQSLHRLFADNLITALMGVCKGLFGARHGTHIYINERNACIFIPRYANPVHAVGRVFLDTQFEYGASCPPTLGEPLEAHALFEMVKLMRERLPAELKKNKLESMVYDETDQKASFFPPRGNGTLTVAETATSGVVLSPSPVVPKLQPPPTTTATAAAATFVDTPPPPPTVPIDPINFL